jgi:hypothetical protein
VVCGDATCKHHKAHDEKEKRRQAEKNRYRSKPENPKEREDKRRKNMAEFQLKAQAFIKAVTPQVIRAQALVCTFESMSDDAEIDSEPVIESFGKKATAYPRSYQPWLPFAKDAKTFEESLQKLVLLVTRKPDDDDYFQTRFMDDVLGKKFKVDAKAIAAKVKELYPETEKKDAPGTHPVHERDQPGFRPARAEHIPLHLPKDQGQGQGRQPGGAPGVPRERDRGREEAGQEGRKEVEGSRGQGRDLPGVRMHGRKGLPGRMQLGGRYQDPLLQLRQFRRTSPGG